MQQSCIKCTAAVLLINEAPKEHDKARCSQHILMVSLLVFEDRTAGLGTAASEQKQRIRGPRKLSS